MGKFKLLLKQLSLLLWKNYIIKKRMWIITLLEIILELLFAILLLMYRKYIPTEHVDSVSYNIQQIETLPSFFQTSTQWELIYVPSNSEVVKNITKRAQKTLGNNIKVRGFSSERAFESYVRYHNESSNVLAAVVFEHTFRHKLESLPLKVRYHLRFSFSPRNTLVTGRLFLMPEEPEGWRTALLFPLYPLPGPRNHFASDGGNPGYISEGFLTIQRAVDKAIIEYHGKDGGKWLNDHVTVSVKRFPFPPFVSDNFLKFLDQVLPLIILLLYSLNVLMIIRVIVQEKEKQLKEYLQMMGLSNWLLWSSYFITFFFSFLITICLLTLFFFMQVFDQPIIYHSDSSLVFIFLLCFALSSMFFGFMISTFFNKANMAVATGGCIYFITYLPYLFISSRYNQMSLDQKLAACLLSNIAMTMGINMIVRFEIKGIGVHWERLTDTVSIDDDLNLGHILGMMLVDAFCYGLAGWYMEVVFPGEYGIPQPWYFFLKRSYWYGYPKPLFRSHKDSEDNSQNQYMEAEPVGLVAGVQIKNLSKVFVIGRRVKEAVKDLTLNLYEGQITVLLGHNGAGKTTTLSMLTGLYPPTSGRAYINGFDITRNMIDIRKSLGLCPQHDLLFDSLTVTEHLYFFAMLKGFPKRKLKNEINFMLHIFNLEDKRNEFSSKLSGGMKRKLSISIALIGDSKVVMLDEPTSGMDLISRRATWDLLQKQKSRRTILLTTHHMDEADLLGDRIAIMAKGGLQCCGSSLFLKKKYGAGYRLIMVKEPQCQIKKVSQLINQFVPNATLESNVGAELSFILPKEDAHKFEDLFTELENKRKSLGIASFGTSVTTMEEVFLKVGKMVDSKMDLQAIKVSDSNKEFLRQASRMSLEGEDMGIYLRDPESEEEDEIEYHTDKNDEKLPRIHHYLPVKFNTGIYLFSQQFYAMLVKRATFSWRNWKLILLQIMVLLTFTAILLRAITFYSEINDDPQLDMSLRHYGRTIVPFSISGGTELSRQLGEYMQTLLIDDRQVPQFVKGSLDEFLLSDRLCEGQCIIAIEIDSHDNKTEITALFNNQAYHSPAAALSLVDNMLLLSRSNTRASITISNKPQPRSAIKAARETYHKGSRGQEIAFSLFFGMAALASSFCLLTVTERIIKAKHLQFVSGVGIINFWCSAFLWDLFIFFIPCLLLLMVFKICHMDAFVEDFHFINTLLIFLVYGWSVIPLMYLMSFFFSSSATAYAKLVVFNFFSGMISFLFVYMAKSKVVVMTNSSIELLDNIFMIFPNHNLGKSISGFYENYKAQKYCTSVASKDCESKGITYEKNFYSLIGNGIGKYIIAMAVSGLIFLLVLFLIESKSWRLKNLLDRFMFFYCYRGWYSKQHRNKGIIEDKDVTKERKKVRDYPVEAMVALEIPLVIRDLVKIYYRKVPVLAVNNISLAIMRGECFGLLGFNGAGKSTTFKMLTGDETISSGNAYFSGVSISSQIRTVQRRISYCPQLDALLDYMTGRELMYMYARLWGIPENHIKHYVKNMLKALLLESNADKLIRNLSGGNKRKLSTCISLIGRPSVVFLDEPSTGMDPVARRLLWDTLVRTRESGKAIVITSHSMEECEALCTKLAIMVAGKLKCLGGPQYLKNKFGSGYTLVAKLKNNYTEDDMEQFKKFIETTFPGSILQYEHQGIIHYNIPSENFSWAKVFGILEKEKDINKLEDYTISQITLEQVFLSFAESEKTENEDDD
ncbi:phospholipid-transporting ATPase ABCA3-like isoform X1 [Monodelphis domestica]|uniref:phospholipid-transporting ATPase ABCA3-like isoform X1 n=1 Tax=Monodelphis domestica TaxID=13616 RepID=UPI00028BEC0E|nr:phospholipid-transporting ATPase ABCA3-like isoform X1 [Monodelphis domestica]XP_007498290.1 phospholipid-transporting ATPase ABCA3-like isoform X1 [Monodelphis domestica]XP_016279362.1 phospholipid-transporting ATPase ABCA3-like isoform X1 [Monodelphis domestica]XP_056662522.1 phospholipid-transporting ATPase ABCA3-like isoform X1 [Monodelphis domestica]